MLKTITAILFVLCVVVAGGVIWTVLCYNWCPFGSSLQITRKTGDQAEKGLYALPSQQGVAEQMRGPGRHFLNPWDYSVRKVRDIVVLPGSIAKVKNNIGKNLPSDRFLAEPDEKGMQRRVLTPGVWRVNTFGQEIILAPATIIEPGYVGVQTLRERSEGQEKGILPDVLQAGYYNINPDEKRIDPIEIGYRVWDIQTQQYTDKSGNAKIVEGSGVSFPLADGKQMYLDFTVVWGIFPENAARIIREYGTVADVERKVIEPQVLSICKNAGSNLTTQQFIEGETREKFQQEVTIALKTMGKEKGIEFLIALVRGFHAAEDIKTTIQDLMIAEEEKKTLKKEQMRDVVAAKLEKARQQVDVAVRDFDAQTDAMVSEESEKGIKVSAEIKAHADRTVASLQRKAAEINAKAIKILGQAEADVIEAIKKAEAKRLELLIAAYGGPEQYNLAIFAQSLREDIQIEYRYAGEGTFWTDIKSTFMDTAAKKILSGQATTKKQKAQGAAD